MKQNKTKKNKRRTTSAKNPFLHRYGVSLLLLFAIGLQVVANGRRPISGHVLAYATNTSVDGLQAAQNNQRTSNSLGALNLHAKLVTAAQNKAHDMINRNYWSHNTPEGNTPWTFIAAAGYSYLKAGENLAYGQSSSTEVVTAWMNSPGHRANILDPDYVDSGFAVVNGANYQGGENTLVVAMYAKPAQTVSPTPPPTVKATPKASPTPPPTAPAPTPAPAPQPQPTTPAVTDQAQTKPDEKKPTLVGFNSDSNSSPPSTPSRNLTSLLHGNAKFSVYLATMATIAGGMWFTYKHALGFRRAFVEGEEYVLTHPAIEVSLLAMASVLLYVGNTGFIR